MSLAQVFQRLRGLGEPVTYFGEVDEQRRARLDSKYAQNRREIHELERSMSAMHTDMTRLNTLISKNTSLQGQLTNDNFNLETSIVNSLKELEAEAVVAVLLIGSVSYTHLTLPTKA